jgi:hypothetical protein
MRHFNDSLTALKQNNRKKVRIAYYSDSNNAMDYASGYLRTFLGRAYGYGGHGYILAGKPLRWYQHRDIKTYNSRGWKTYQPTIPRTSLYPYGHAGGVGVGHYRGAYTLFKSQSTSFMYDKQL